MGCVMGSFASTFQGVLGWAVVTGWGIGWTGYIASGICVQWFVKSRGRMSLLAQSGQGMGSFTYTLLVGKLLDGGKFTDCFGGGEEDWRKVMRIFGLGSIVIGTLASCVMRLPRDLEVELHEHILPESEIIKEGNEEEEDDEVLGLLKKDNDYGSVQLSGSTMYGGKSMTRRSHRPNGMLVASIKALDISLAQRNFNEYVVHQHSSSKRPVHHDSFSIAEYASLKQLPISPSLFSESIREEETLTLTQTLMTRTTMSLIVWNICISWSLIAFYEHLPAFANSIGVTTEESANMLSLSGLFLITGNLTLSFVIDRYGPIVGLRSVACVLACVLFSWPYSKSKLTLQVLACIYGYCLVVIAMPIIILADVFGDVAPSAILFLLGLLNFCAIPGYLFGPTVVGYLYDVYGSYTYGAMFTGISITVGIVALGFIPNANEQKKRLGIPYCDLCLSK